MIKKNLLLNIAKSNQEIVENTHSKPQETLELKMTKQKESFSKSSRTKRKMDDGSNKFRSIQHCI